MTHVTLREDRVQPGVHPFTVPWLLPSLDLQLSAPATFLVGENGTGKSTLLEAIAWAVGFGAQGGNRDQSFAENADGYALGRALRLSWRQKVSGGFFLRAETFFNFATYLEDVGSPFIAYGANRCTNNPTARHSCRCSSIASKTACTSSTNRRPHYHRSDNWRFCTSCTT